MQFPIFDIAGVSMEREQLRMRQAAMRVADWNARAEGSAFGAQMDTQSTPASAGTASASVNQVSTLAEMTLIMRSARAYEANVSVVTAARSAFEKALEITARR